MGAYAWRIDPSGTVYNLTDNTNTFLTGQEVPPPPTAPQFVSSRDVDGDALVDTRYGNRTVTLNIRVVGSSQSDIEDRTQLLQAAITKLHREGGVLEGTSPAGTVFYLTVLDAQMTLPQGKRYMTRLIAEPTLEFTCSPEIYTAEQTLSDHVETSSPCLIFTEASVGGDLPGRARIVIDEDQGYPQRFVAVGLRSKNYSSDSAAALFYQAESLTALNSATAIATSGASGSSNNAVQSGLLTSDWQGIVSTGNLKHVGRYRVFARVIPESGNLLDTDVAFEWSVGDFQSWTRNAQATVTYKYGNVFYWVDLGMVGIPQVQTGTQRWSGRVVAKNSGGSSVDKIRVDCIGFFPVDEFYAEARAVDVPNPSSSTARDEFQQSAGSLTSKTLPVGGTWTHIGSGDTDDFSASGSGTATRTAVSDSGSQHQVWNGRLLYPSSIATTTAGVVTGVDVKQSAENATDGATIGVFARYVDASNFLCLYLYNTSSHTYLRIQKRVAGSGTVLNGGGEVDYLAVGTYGRMRLTVNADGTYVVEYTADTSQPLEEIGRGYDADLASGGSLDDGRCGIMDHQVSASASTRTYANYYAYPFVTDAAVFASQSIQFRHDGPLREDSAGAVWTRPSFYQGDNFLIPPSGREGRTCEVVVKASRGLPVEGIDAGVDDISAQVFVQACYLTLPT